MRRERREKGKGEGNEKRGRKGEIEMRRGFSPFSIILLLFEARLAAARTTPLPPSCLGAFNFPFAFLPGLYSDGKKSSTMIMISLSAANSSKSAFSFTASSSRASG